LKLFLTGPTIEVIAPQIRAAEYWRALGHTVISSAELDVAEGADPVNGWAPVVLSDEYLGDVFRRNVAALVECDAIVLVGGWRNHDECKTLLDVATLSDMTAFAIMGTDLSGNEIYTELDEDFDYIDEAETSSPLVGSPEFHKIIDNVVALHNKKSMDYGKGDDPFYNLRASQRYGIPAWVSCMIRSDDKSHRIQKAYTDGADSLVNESVVDSFEDKIIYDVLALILYKESVGDLGR